MFFLKFYLIINPLTAVAILRSYLFTSLAKNQHHDKTS